MQCFNHQTDAVATCKHCNKGVCHECVAIVEGVSSCLGACEEKVREFERFTELSKQAILKTSKSYIGVAIFMLLAGLTFIIIGVVPVLVNGYYGVLYGVPMGLIFLLGAFFNLKSAKKIKSDEKL